MSVHSKNAPTPGSEIDLLLKATPEDYVGIVLAKVRDIDPDSMAMCLIAYINLTPLLMVGQHYISEGGAELPKSLDEWICRINGLRDRADNEIAYRRNSWFLFALLIMRASNLAENNVDLRCDAGEMWKCLLMATANVKKLLTTIIWNDQEKEWFLPFDDPETGAVIDPLADNNQAMVYALNVIAPKWVKTCDRIVEFAKSRDIQL